MVFRCFNVFFSGLVFFRWFFSGLFCASFDFWPLFDSVVRWFSWGLRQILGAWEDWDVDL